MWVDPDTPTEHYTWVTSRGETWNLVMSDEFNIPGRSFRPGDDHIWTSIEKPDGVNDAMEVYAHNKTYTACDEASSVCSFQIELEDSITELQVWNSYLETPSFENVTFFYRGGMVQSWNKFCFQGGMVEVRAQLPGALSETSGNPDIHLGPNARAQSLRYYPTWPGIWMLGNLGRAIFSGSTNRMWPFSYDACEPDILPPNNQRISACDPNPGSGMNPHQGRGAPEIDLVEGGGTTISASIQVGPGMPPEFRVIPPRDENKLCIYSSSCKTPGANVPGIPNSVYLKARGHPSWYQNLRYAANNFCQRNASEVQSYATVKAALRAGVENNLCSVTTCPASLDINSDLTYMNADTNDRWGINSNGTCFSARNSYMGEFICSAGNTDPRCKPVEGAPIPPNNGLTFAFQMDALSANWPVHMAVYTEFVEYQVEWVFGPNGYVRWLLSGEPLYEISAKSITEPPQGASVRNPSKIMIEEPMYIIFNVAMSSKWGAQPPNPKNPCRGNGLDPVANAICDAFPMHLKIDYIRVYQDISPSSPMSLGCNPVTHPTRQWIIDHLDEYEDEKNKYVEVRGKAFCRSDNDCTVQTPHDRRRRSYAGPQKSRPAIVTGKCVNQRCECTSQLWTGPRCIVPTVSGARSFGPSVVMAACIGSILLLLGISSFVALYVVGEKLAEAFESERKIKQQQRQQYGYLRRQSSHTLRSAEI
ncbi:Concanavalin A-like lectin/glucanase, subgroup [Plasmopara halstedii]|uniref:Concanavalin A-like lectin/glucanase, subgroup n=1 Tax=Plasmopara halstedii TaxID=4781 RepID=A0A0N7L8I4_PLAHL|nr:Concanavalin A-like lectin/glucanase, subgroup [Plasmopara halstedii]CEG49963.1 Concanavalin A-like lectin/glucanase, subgroup [Plasmopara halstedii]|eukprot:XP_024586332.1 Concanavalin A-like lectin/glucanase, subgroup [Plasmopara halstedii]